MTTDTNKQPRRQGKPAEDTAAPSGASPAVSTTSVMHKPVSKLERLVALLLRPEGASLHELAEATGWQAHSVRGAISGALRKKGHNVHSELVDGTRRYRFGAAE